MSTNHRHQGREYRITADAVILATGAQARTVSNDPRWFTKFDFVLNENHRLEASIFSDEKTWSQNSLFRMSP